MGVSIRCTRCGKSIDRVHPSFLGSCPSCLADSLLAETPATVPLRPRPAEIEALSPPATGAREEILETPAPPPEVTGAPPSARFGRFVRVQKVGSGGMGEVWKSWDTRLSRWVALKFLKDEDPDEVARFTREARTAGGLTHAHIAAIHEIGHDQGRHYIVMQFVAGPTLEKFPRRDRGLLVRLVRDAARAVAFAHRQGVVHRDLKPRNIMVSRTRGGWHAVVTDFGLAKSLSEGSTLSGTGDLVGTPGYLSPEQARGDRANARSDIYALGATLYELLTGSVPFHGTNVYETLRMIQEEAPRPPRKLDASVSTDLETIVLTCLEKDPARRYATAEDLVEDLERSLRGDSIRARRAGAGYRLRRLLARRRVQGALAAVVALALLVLWLAATLRAKARAEAMAEGYRLWAELEGISKGEQTRESLSPLAVKARGEFEKAERITPTPEARVMIGLTHQVEGRYPQALQAWAGAMGLDAGHRDARLHRAKWLWMSYLKSRVPRLIDLHADPGSRRARLRREEAPEVVKETSSESEWARQARELLAGLPEKAEGRELLLGLQAMGEQKYLQAAEHLRGYTSDHSWDALAWRAEGLCWLFEGKEAPALRCFNRVIDLSPVDPVPLCNRANARWLAGEPEKALEDYNEAIRLDGMDASSYYNRGGLHFVLGNTTAAIKDYDDALKHGYNRLRVLENRAVVEEARGAFADLERTYGEIIPLAPRPASFRLARARVRISLGKARYDDALADLGAVIASQEKPLLAQAHFYRGEIHRAQRRPAEAEADFARAEELGQLRLLPLVDAGRDVLHGRAAAGARGMIEFPAGGERTLLQVPYSPGKEYELSIYVEKLPGAGSFEIGLATAQAGFVVVLDGGPDGATSGIELIDGRAVEENGTALRGPLLKPAETWVLCRVREKEVIVEVDGKRRLSWSGDLSRVSLPARCSSVVSRALFLGSSSGGYRIADLVYIGDPGRRLR